MPGAPTVAGALDLQTPVSRLEGGEVLVIFTPSGRRGHFAVGTPVLQAARTLGVDIDSVCGGRGICGRCQVLVGEGDFPKFGIQSNAASLCPITEPELRFSKQRGLKAGRRLGCHAKLERDVVIDVPPDSQVYRPVVRKDAVHIDFKVDPVIHLHFVEVAEPDMHEPSADLRRLQQALAAQWQLEGLSCGLAVRQTLQKQLRAGDWKVTVAVRDRSEIVAVWPGIRERAYGLAIDVGSTTIAAHLCDLSSGDVAASAGTMNPQIRFGEDLMSRVSYIVMHPGGETELTAAVRGALNDLIGQVAAEAGIDRQDVLEATFVGNPVMHHLLLGINPVELGMAPFALADDAAVDVTARELELAIHPGAHVYGLPCIAGHVGADTAAVILAEGPHLGDPVTLLVDVGTNAEIVLGNRHRLLAASSPTGPAFEGAQISCGQRAAPGAIERVRIDRDTLEPRFKVVGCELWSDEPGFAKTISKTGVTGVCGSGIVEVIAEMYLAGIISSEGVIDGAMATRSSRVIPDGRTFSFQLTEGAAGLRITQNDVRAIQLAKAALYAGVRLLMERMDIERVDRIRLAGAFGSHIDVKYAMVLGLIPDCDLGEVAAAGNAAGVGARIALTSLSKRREIEALVRRVEKIETAVEPRFQEHFIDSMAIPHKTDAFPSLAQVVDLPKHELGNQSPAGANDRRSRRRRRV